MKKDLMEREYFVDDKTEILYLIISHLLGTIIVIGSIFPVMSITNLLNMYLTIYRTGDFYTALSSRLVLIVYIFIMGIVWIAGFFLLQNQIEKHIYNNKKKVARIFTVSLAVETILYLIVFMLTSWLKM